MRYTQTVQVAITSNLDLATTPAPRLPHIHHPHIRYIRALPPLDAVITVTPGNAMTICRRHTSRRASSLRGRAVPFLWLRVYAFECCPVSDSIVISDLSYPTLLVLLIFSFVSSPAVFLVSFCCTSSCSRRCLGSYYTRSSHSEYHPI